MRNVKKWGKQLLCTLMAAAVAAASAGCGTGGAASGQKTAVGGDSQIVNIGVTDSLSSLNPLTIDATEINKYATSMMFLPLVELNSKMEFEGALADSITTKDNKTFTVALNKNAVWSDGKPVTADDVAFTVLRLCSPVIANTTMSMSALVGTGEDGFVKKGATSVSGVKVLNDKTLTFTMKQSMALTTFENSYARYMMPVPKHVLQNVSEEQLAKYAWFNSPTVVDGPYIATAVDTNHYISYKANEKYWKGAPKISKMNIKILAASQIYAGLKSGEIDFVQQTMAAIPQEDYTNIEALDNVTAKYGKPVTTQSLFLNTKTIPDVRVRQAIQYAIDRNLLLKNLLNGKGEVVDGFLTSASPFYNKSLTPTTYDPEKAKTLLRQANWGSGKTLSFYVNSGDTTFVNGSSVIKEELRQVGINVEIHTVDLSTLMSTAGSQKFDLLAVQYTYAPVDPYPDVRWLLGGAGSWTNFSSPVVDKALAQTQQTSDKAEIAKQYLTIDQTVQKQVPMINTYVISALGAVSKRLENAEPTVYGSFINIQNWEIQ
ncbi:MULTISPECIES: ABC transporter substrate-binding protein [Caproicibacterium]|uniref:ABC transporter substrate-binding protein n=1 Tax=Caproicibacterium argilliputei TaxID=3030016 RepID=A0AA97D832_9FIRM|nr:ABC transporter substrate-binding protein [Caproicibacterium argilliputei]WOC31404.1 ABC transporter substrate-binding protein [Caproicibacterium argilliputei]